MPDKTLIVFYDGGCPLCSREISHYRRLEARAPVDWIDVTQPGVDLTGFGLTTEAAMRRFHVRDASGTMQIGAAGFLTLWAVLPFYRWLALVLRAFRTGPLLAAVYNRFADWHYRRRCRDGVCGLPENDG